MGSSQAHPVTVVTSPPTAAAAVATTTASPKETVVGSALSTPSAHTPPASSSQSLSVSSLPLSSSSGHGMQAPAAGASPQQGHSRPGQVPVSQGMTSSAVASSLSALTVANVSNALQQQQQNTKVLALVSISFFLSLSLICVCLYKISIHKKIYEFALTLDLFLFNL